MIQKFKHKGLKKFFENGSTAGIIVVHAPRLRAVLTMLDAAQVVEEMNAPGLRLHALMGDLKGQFAVTISGNWRVTFEFKNGNAYIVDYQDYH